MLFEFHEVLYQLFDYYAALGSSDNIFQIQVTAWTGAPAPW